MSYAVHVMIAVDDANVATGAVRECDTVSDVLASVREILIGQPDFRGITVVHLEDLPALMEGAEHLGASSEIAKPPPGVLPPMLCMVNIAPDPALSTFLCLQPVPCPDHPEQL